MRPLFQKQFVGVRLRDDAGLWANPLYLDKGRCINLNCEQIFCIKIKGTVHLSRTRAQHMRTVHRQFVGVHPRHDAGLLAPLAVAGDVLANGGRHAREIGR